MPDLATIRSQIRQIVSIDELVREDGGELVRMGNKLRCRSPLREDRNPSFYVYVDQDSWWDYGTGEGGDVFDYIQLRDGIDHVTAVKLLADRVGIEWAPARKMPEAAQKLIDSYLESRYVFKILTAAARYYHDRLPDYIRELVRNTYGFTDETIDACCIGWAEEGQGVLEYLRSLKYSDEKILKTGLVLILAGGVLQPLYDRRIIMPYWRDSLVQYMIGRKVEDETPDNEYEQGKYKKLLVHNPENRRYVSKYIDNSIFYGEDSTRRIKGTLIITEGVTDAISAIQEGYACVSPVTTRFRKEDHPRLLLFADRFSRIVVVNDEEEKVHAKTGEKINPGFKGALETVNALFAAGHDARILRLPRKKGQEKVDLNSFLRDEGKEAFEKLLEDVKPHPTFLIEQVPKDTSPADFPKALSAVLDVIAKCDKLQQEAYINLVAKRFKIQKRTILELVAVRIKQDVSRAARGDPNDPRYIGNQVVTVRDRSYYKFDTAILSNFVLVPKERIVTSHARFIVVDALVQGDKEFKGIAISDKAWVSTKSFKDQLSDHTAELNWFGTHDNEVQFLANVVHGTPMETYRGTEQLGYYKDTDGVRWITGEVALDKDGIIENPRVRFVSKGHSFERRLQYILIPRDEAESLAAQFFQRLLDVNEPEIILPVAGWFMASLLAPPIREALGHHPLLWIWGSAGSGKTSTVQELLWPIVGVARDRNTFSVTETSFTQISTLSMTSSIPVVWDEYKPSDMPKQRKDQVHRLARRVYGKEMEQRGQRNLKITEYQLAAPLCVCGEALPTETALMERVICVAHSKNTLTAARKKAFLQLAKLPLYRLAGTFVRMALNLDVPARLEQAREDLRATLSKAGIELDTLPPRIADNLTVVMFGIWMLDIFALELKTDLPATDLPRVFRQLIFNVMGVYQDDGDGTTEWYTKDVADLFFESLSGYAHLGLIQPGVHYTFSRVRELETGKDLLCFHLRTAYDTYLAERRKRGLEDETNGYGALRRAIREKVDQDSYVKTARHSVRLAPGKVPIKAVVVDQDKMVKVIDADPFPADHKSWETEDSFDDKKPDNGRE